jgi:type IV pilus assembly protein PilM
MPSNQAVWGIEIGQCALKAIRLRHDAQNNKVEALAFDYIEHPKILSQPDADPDALSREAIQTFLSRNVVKGDRVVIGVPGQSGLARFIKLPPVEPSRIPEIVKYEARQQIPFALEEVVWDFQTIGNAEEAGGFALETEIGLFAMKRDLIYRFMNPFREAGVEVDVVQMRPLAVYNFAAFDQISNATDEPGAEAGEEKEEGEYQREELVESKKPVEPAGDGFVVLLDMGADNSDLVITDGMRIWQRNLPIGGNHFTRALTKELKLTFAKAEHLKRNATKAQDPRAIFQAMRPVFNDLVSEIQRSIGYFSSVHRQSKISRIIGMGNAFKLPGLQKFLAQNLQYEVEKVETFKCVKGDQVLSAPAFQENILSFSVVYGLALQGLEVSGVRTSLLPPEISQARMIRRKKPWALSAAAILMAGFTALFFGSWAQLNAVSSTDFNAPKQKAEAAKKLQSEKKTAYESAKNAWTTVKTNGEKLTENVDKRLDWIEIFRVLRDALPQNPPGDLKELVRTGQLGEVTITNITATYLDDVKAGWYDKLSQRPNDWPQTTMHPLDKKTQPTGPGWHFVLDGYHLNKGKMLYATTALMDRPTAFQSAVARHHGIQAAVITDVQVDSNWSPNSDKTKTTRRRSRSGGGGGAVANRSASATAGGGGIVGGGGMGGGGGGGMAGVDERTTGGDEGALEGGGGRMLGGDENAGGAVASRAALASSTAVSIVNRTDFVLEFVWFPEKSKVTPVTDWQKQMQEAGAPRRNIPPELERPSAKPAAPATSQPGSAAPGDQPPAANTPPAGQPAPTTPPAPTGQPPGNPPAPNPGATPG